MQWPDAIVGAAETKGRRSGALGVAERGAGADAIAALFGSTGVPTGLDLPCKDDPELFFAEAPEDVEAAKALCRGCLARETCLQGALQRREPWGVWGGQLLLRGTVVPRKRPRGRPRKQDAALAKADDQAA
jgi:WhiB family redox-sensing transcriptional regulator